MVSDRKNLQIERQTQEALFIGRRTQLLEEISEKLHSQDVDNYFVPLTSSSEKLHEASTITPGSLLLKLQSIQPDYLIILVDASYQSWISSKENLNLLQKAESNISYAKKVYLVTDPSFPNNQLSKEGKKLFITELFGEGMQNDTAIIRIAKQVIDSGQISVPGDGLDLLNPISLKDAVSAILKVIFDPYIDEKEIRIQSPEEISYLNLAYKIRALLPIKSELAFQAEEKIVKPGKPLYEITKWQPETTFDEELEKAIKWIEKTHKPSTKSQPRKAKLTQEISPTRLQPLRKKREGVLKKISQSVPKQPEFIQLEKSKNLLSDKLKTLRLNRKSKKQRKTTPKLAITLILLIYFISIIVSGFITTLGLKKVKTQMTQGQIIHPVTLTLTSFTTKYLEFNTNFLISLPGLKNTTKIQELSTLMTTVDMALEIAQESRGTLSYLQKMVSHIMGREEGNIEELISLSKIEIDTLYKKLSLLDGLLPASPPSIIPIKYQVSYLSIKKNLRNARKTTLSAKAILNTSRELLGVGETRKYVILLQNNMELRATGGFIGSFAIAELENAQLFNLQVFDVYQADGQLKGHVEPPEPIKEHLGEANWFLRDSNWDPDFPTTARRVEWFIDKTIQKEVDGVIGIDLYTIQSIIEALGPLKVPDYDEEITVDNLFERAEYHAEINFFPGSTQKKEFLAALTDSLFLKLEELGEEEIAAVAFNLYSALQQNDLILSTQDKNIDAVLDQLGWSGNIKTPPCPVLETNTSNCLNDYLFVVDSNVGVNKANYFVKRRSDIVVTIQSDRTVRNKLTLTYVNTSTSSSWPAGSYKNYQRLYLPKNTTISSIKINGKALRQNDISLEAKHNKTVVGYLVNVPISSTAQVEVIYELGPKLAENNPIYTLYWQKQPGTAPQEPLTVFLNYPLYLEPGIISPESEILPQQLIFELSNSQDRRITVSF